MTVVSTSTPSTNTVHPSVNDMDWFAGVAEEELLYYTGVGNDVDSLWAVIGSFVPPPPRPPYLPEEAVTTDGLTTCDLCSWAWRNDRHSFSLDGTLGKCQQVLFTVFSFSLPTIPTPQAFARRRSLQHATSGSFDRIVGLG